MTGAFNAVALTAGARRLAARRCCRTSTGSWRPMAGARPTRATDQPSHAFLTAELKELSTSATILPPIFLIVAAALVHLVVSRLVEAEREQIGLLKAFGYGDCEAAAPYLRLAAVIGAGGRPGRRA